MADATSISFGKFLESVQSAVKSAAAKHPKFKVEVPNGVTISYLIRGFPIPDGILATVTVGETQAFANEVAGQIAAAHPQVGAAAAAGAAGAILSVGGHIIVGIPPATQALLQVQK
jgi:hypothetical protein